ncbi:MAG: glycosyltransferase family 4 protein [Planctomycetota bacterium]
MSSKACPNVLLLLDQSGSRWSSQEDFCICLSRTLRSSGARCVVVYSSQPTAAAEKALTDAGAVLDVACQHKMSLPRFCWKIRGLCRRHKIGVTHLQHYVPSSRLIAALALSLPCPIIVGDCTGGEGKPRPPLSRRLFHAFNRLMNASIAGIVAPSRFVRERLIRSRGIAERKAWCIPNGVDLERFHRRGPPGVREELGLSSAQHMILTAGNLLPLKAVDVLLTAFVRVLEEHPDSVLVIAGDGPERGRLERLAEELGVSGRTTFLGQRSDVPHLLSAAAIFCCPSVWAEAFGWVNAEAMACEVPVVSTTAGAIPEVVEHGETGLLVPPGDPDAMAAAIIELLASPERRKAMGEAGRRRAEKLFDLRQVVPRYVALYADVAAGRRAQNTIT